jgi:hypothetical protein
VAGWVRDGVIDQIRAELTETFHGAATPQLVPVRNALRPQDIVAYAYLHKELNFPACFERLDSTLDFQGTPVVPFGVGPYKPGQRSMYDQVAILDYQGQDDFIIELLTQSPDDQLLLAKVARGPTLEVTIRQVLARISGVAPVPMNVGDVLEIPKMDFEIFRRFDEIMHRHLVVQNPDVARDLEVLVARQDVRFQMNEAGVKLRSESSLTFGCSARGEPQPTHRLIFDRPFLLMLKRRPANQPYFAVWIENAELLVPAD